MLVLASVETNVTPGEYETERAFYGTDKVKAPKVNDDFVRVRMGFTNIGAEGEVVFYKCFQPCQFPEVLERL